MNDTIIVEGLEFEAIIGILPHERKQKQPLRVDILLYVPPITPAAQTDHIDQTVDYAQVCEQVAELARNGRFQLVETFAERACEHLLQTFPIKAVSFKVIKPHALPEADGVGVSITRRAED